ncbi:MAG: PD40 domain-containing protein, partial [Rhizobacter sp.]|nr:PD40 domain-containing protein [Chlorobiales bacterium]
MHIRSYISPKLISLFFAAVFIAAFTVALPTVLHAQFFGRNKVSYTAFDWQVLKTEHFDIYYYPEMKPLAERAAAYAEESYRFLENKFNQNISNRTPIIFYSSHLHFQQTNVTPGFIPEGVGGFFEFLKGRVVIPADGNLTQFKRVIRHELVHVFQYAKTIRVLKDHRQPPDRTLPLWLTEGHAEYWSGEVDTQSEMVIRDAVMNNYIVPLSQMQYIYGTYLMYKEGESICKFIAEKYGEEKILQLYDNFWKSSNFDDVLKLTIGKTAEEFDKEWLYSLRKKYYPNYESEDPPSQVALTITSRGFNSKPVFYKRTITPPRVLAGLASAGVSTAPDSSVREIYYISNRLGYTSLYRTTVPNDETHYAINSNPFQELPNEMIVKGEQSDEFEAFHPFQSKIDISREGILAFVTKSGENDAIHFYDLKKDEHTRTVSFNKLVSLGSVNWSPDGVSLVFSAIGRNGHSDLYLYNAQSGDLRKLTNDFYDDRDPAFSPDGKYIAFSSDRTSFGINGKYNLFLFDLETLHLA